MSARCESGDWSQCDRGYCNREFRCAERDAAAPATRPDHASAVTWKHPAPHAAVPLVPSPSIRLTLGSTASSTAPEVGEDRKALAEELREAICEAISEAETAGHPLGGRSASNRAYAAKAAIWPLLGRLVGLPAASLPAVQEEAMKLPAGWQSIETAPRDGSAVLVMRDIWPGTESGHAEECNGHNTYVAEWWSEEEGSGRWVCYMDAIQDPDCPVEPTHWMPLPAPPLAASKTEGGEA